MYYHYLSMRRTKEGELPIDRMSVNFLIEIVNGEFLTKIIITWLKINESRISA